MTELAFPALYNDADAASANAQKEYLRLIKGEYALLFVAAILTMQTFNSVPFYIFYALIFIVSLVLMLLRTLKRPDQDWYKCRALAESIKTATWRYAMRAEPFDDARTQDARRDFRSLLKEIFDANQHIGARISGLNPDGQQMTPSMDQIRDKGLEDRCKIYLDSRIRDQRTWYRNKSKSNKKIMNFWIGVCVVVYLAAAASVLYRISDPVTVLPIEPLIVVASSIVGWMQIKKFSELSSAYALTAHEIGIIEGRMVDMIDDEKFSQFVNEAELAFSREHTQWVARQQHA